MAHLIYLRPGYQIKSHKLRILGFDTGNNLKDQKSKVIKDGEKTDDTNKSRATFFFIRNFLEKCKRGTTHIEYIQEIHQKLSIKTIKINKFK